MQLYISEKKLRVHDGASKGNVLSCEMYNIFERERIFYDQWVEAGEAV